MYLAPFCEKQARMTFGSIGRDKVIIIIPAYYLPTAGQRPLLIQRRHEHITPRLRVGDFRLILISPGFLTMFFLHRYQ